MSEYGESCPVARAMELLDGRWTMLVVRDLLNGRGHFNEIRNGNPRMSSALLAERLRMLVRHGLAERREDGNHITYVLTPAGLELGPIVEAIGDWGVRWAGHLGDRDLDPPVLLWDLHHHIDHAALPPGRTVVQFVFPEVEPRLRSWWLVLTADTADLCDDDRGHEVDVRVTTDLQTLTAVWAGERAWHDALRERSVVIEGSEALRRRLPAWLRLSVTADEPHTTPTMAS